MTASADSTNRATVNGSVGSTTSIRWCGMPPCSTAVGLAVPTSIPRYTCIESTLRTSALASRAAASETAVLPDAVGPRITRMGQGTAIKAPAAKVAGTAHRTVHRRLAQVAATQDLALGP